MVVDARTRSLLGSGSGFDPMSTFVIEVLGVEEHLVGLADLDQRTEIHHRHAVADVTHHRQVVRDE